MPTSYTLEGLFTQMINLFEILYKIFASILRLMTSPITMFFQSIGTELLIAIIVAIILAILGFLYKKKILMKLKALLFWLTDYQIKIDSFIGYIAIAELSSKKFEKLYAHFKDEIQKDGFYNNEFTEREPLVLKSIFLKKDNLSFRLDIIDIPADAESHSYYKIKFNLMEKNLGYRTSGEKLKDTINQIIKISDKTIGSFAGKPNYVITIPNRKHKQFELSQHGTLTIIHSRTNIQIKDTNLTNTLKFTKTLFLG